MSYASSSSLLPWSRASSPPTSRAASWACQMATPSRSCTAARESASGCTAFGGAVRGHSSLGRVCFPSRGHSQNLPGHLRNAGWEVGAIWTLDRHAEALRCIDVWSLPGINATEFETITRTIQFTRGVGLPGRVWARGEPVWIHDVVFDQNFPLAPIAAEQALHGAFAFPIVIRRQVVGVIEFFSRDVRTPDQDLLSMMADVGIKIGQFVERTESAERLGRINDCLLSFCKDTN